jgi:4-amino-4-deoxy-L-arabinose transferase-like glycosyltransferase
MAWLLPVTQDEAYYFDWAQRLAWGYFDHPPGVALLGQGVRLAPGSALAARLGTLIAGALTLLVLVRLYRRSGLAEGGALPLALVLVAGTLPGLAGGFLATPDTPLALCWALALHESERALAGDRRRWIGAGIATGLGLLSKYTMVAMGPVLLLAILKADPRALRTPWPYLGGLAALLVFAPNLIWNVDHDWLTLRFQFGHGFATDSGPLAAGAIEHSGPQTPVERLGSLLGYLGTQLGLWGLLALPILALPWLGRVAGPKDRGSGLLPQARALLGAAALVPLGLFALVSLASEVEPNWPAMYLLGAAPLLARPLLPIRRWVYAAAGVNLLLATLYGVQGATGALPLPEGQNRIVRETQGFRELAAVAGRLDAPVYADRYQWVAMLRFYNPGLGATQWPGIARPSEYLLGRIAPRVEPASVDGPFWLLASRAQAPEIPGFAPGERRTLRLCPGRPLVEGDEPGCARPLAHWHLIRYRPARPTTEPPVPPP